MIALTAYLSSRQYVPYARLSELIKNITNISMSQGTIFNLLDKAATIVLPIYDGIKEEVSKATTVGGDESGVKVKKANLWAWTWQSLLATYIVISRTRGYATIEKTFPAGFPNATYVSDCLSAQLKTVAGRHQLCLAHLLRELNYFEQIYHHQWVIEMKDLLKRAIKLKQSIATDQYGQPLEERSAILREFKILINQPLPDNVPKIFLSRKGYSNERDTCSIFCFILMYRMTIMVLNAPSGM